MAELGEAPKEGQAVQQPSAISMAPWRNPANWCVSRPVCLFMTYSVFGTRTGTHLPSQPILAMVRETRTPRTDKAEVVLVVMVDSNSKAMEVVSKAVMAHMAAVEEEEEDSE